MGKHKLPPLISPKRAGFLRDITAAEKARIPDVVIRKLSSMTYAAEPAPLFAKNILLKLTELKLAGKLTYEDEQRYIYAFRNVPASPSRKPLDILAYCQWNTEEITEKSEGSMSPRHMVEASILSIGEIYAKKVQYTLQRLKREDYQEE